MEGKRLSSHWQSNSRRSFNLLAKIKEFTRALVLDLSNGRSPVILIDRFRNHCTNLNSDCFCGSDLPSGKEVLTLCRESHVHRVDVMLRVLLIVQKLLQEKRHCSKRDIYYMHPSVFSDQSVVDHAINDICVLMQCSRHNLNVVSAGNGLVMGWIRFFEGTKMVECISSPNTAHPIPVHVEEVKDIISVAHYILVVEKESVFQRLANDQFCNTNHCIVITGRGYPDIPTRRFLRLLVENLHLPAYCLVDCDPYGFDILTTYRFGSMQMAYDTKHLRVPEIQWLGAFPSDSERYLVPKQCLLPLTAEDKRKIEAMLLRCYLQREVPQWRMELEIMLQKGVKFEIEALSVHTLSFLSDSYLPSKVQGCKVKVMQVLGNIRGVYNVTVDGEEGTVKVTGRVNPRTLLSVLQKYGKHAEVKYVKFDGEVMDIRDPYYYGEGNGYGPYGSGATMECSSYPSLPYPPQHQCYQPCVAPPPPRMPLAPPPPCYPPVAPLFFPPFGPLPPVWPPPTRPYGPPPLAPEWPPPPPQNAPRGETSNTNNQSECIVM